MNLVLKINEIIKELGYDETPEVSVSNRPDISDYQYNGTFKLAKIMHKSPMVIADEIVSKLKDNDMFKEVSNVNGFINITLSDKSLIDYLNEIVNNFDINTFKINTDETIFLDYGGANVAKALHAGHLRSPNIGEALKRLCEAVGYKTISDVHYGDWGRPMGLIICEIKHRYPNLDFFNPNLDSYPKESPVTLEDLYTIYPLASAKAKEDEEYYMDDDLIDAINQYPEPFELVEPILEIIGTHPRVDFGMPGDLVHFLEQFYKHGYEELLVSSVRKNPTAHNIWMVHRCFNDVNNPKREMFAKLMKELKDDSSVSMDIKKEIDEFDWEI